MSIKICTSEYLISDTGGLGVRRAWFPRVVGEAFLESTRDGEITQSPDPVTMIEGDVAWFNNSDGAQNVAVMVHRGPRSIVAQSPTTVVIHDAWSWAIGKNPTADFPSAFADTFGGKFQIDRPSAAAADLLYGRVFIDTDDSQVMVNVGKVPAMQSFHFRYRAAVQTPGVWIRPSEFEDRFEAQARWTRLVALGWPA
jgi:hypothetical protein